MQVRRKGRAVSETFVRYEGARNWAIDAERAVDRGEIPSTFRVSKAKTLTDLIDLHIADVKEVGKAPGRSRSATLRFVESGA